VIALYRVDDRLVHGQVVLGWGQPMHARFIVLVDDNVAGSQWEQDLYRMGVPPGMEVRFARVDEAAQAHQSWVDDSRVGIVLTADIGTMTRLVDVTGGIRQVNIGGIHHRAGRTQKLRYVFLTPEEEAQLRALEAKGVKVTAQDVPTARPVPSDALLSQQPQS
jgi:mannose/fructose/N-acetylgalactosamine-specific phosphotransferase system component IIB